MKKPRIYYTDTDDTCESCRHGWTPVGALAFHCDKHDRDVRIPDCHRCRDWEPKHGQELPVDVPSPS